MITPNQWREIAEAYLTPYDERTGRQFQLTESGICWAIAQIINYLNPDEGKSTDYLSKFNDSNHWFWCPVFDDGKDFKPIYDIYRGMFCLLMAEYVKDGV